MYINATRALTQIHVSEITPEQESKEEEAIDQYGGKEEKNHTQYERTLCVDAGTVLGI